MSGHVFISYSRADRAYVEKLATFLETAGIPCWYDHELATGDRWAHVIRAEIDRCAAFVVVMTPAAEESKWVSRELAWADGRKPIFPLLLAGEPFFALFEKQFENVTGERLPGASIVNRLRSLVTVDSAPASPPPPTVTPHPVTQRTSTPGTASDAPLAAVANASLGAALRTPRPVPPNTTTENVAPPRHTNVRTSDQRSRLVPRTRRAKALTGGVAIVALAMTVVVALLMANNGIDRTGMESGNSSQNVTILAGHTDKVTRVTFSPDGKTLATAGDFAGDYTVRLWDVATGETTATLTSVDDVEFSPDSKFLAMAIVGGTVQLRDLATGKTTATALTGYEGSVSMAFSPDAKTLATASTCACNDSFDNPVRLWDLATGKSTALAGHTNGVQSMAFSPDGKTLAAGAAGGGPVLLWDVATGKTTATLAEGDPVAFSPDGTTLATSTPRYGSDKTVRLWDVATGQTTATLPDAYPVAFSLNSTTLAISSADNTVRLREVATGQTTATLAGHTDHINDVAFSPDGKTLATASSDKTVRLWHFTS